ncbi:tetratricopeptide repeat protein [Zymomonas mobilis]|uniref:tetratricopeptide repeat protein n=1 Tax=Zymomonas mobilis TaxID=542 RepID=UPI001154A53F|nr:tetratricopeptide repeat protein [Zymomonas mobilis]
MVASSLYEAAYKLAPWRIDLKIQMGNMTKDSGFLEKAEKIYRSIITDFPEEPESYVQLGHVYKISGRRQAAINCYQKALKLDEKCEAAYKELYLAGETAIQQTTFTQKNIFLGLEKTLEISNQIDALKQSVKK